MDATEAVRQVLEEEIQRQRRPVAEVCRSAKVHKNVLYKLRDKTTPSTLTVPTLWALTQALGLPLSEFGFRVEKRMQG